MSVKRKEWFESFRQNAVKAVDDLLLGKAGGRLPIESLSNYLREMFPNNGTLTVERIVLYRALKNWADNFEENFRHEHRRVISEAMVQSRIEEIQSAIKNADLHVAAVGETVIAVEIDGEDSGGLVVGQEYVVEAVYRSGAQYFYKVNGPINHFFIERFKREE